MTLQYLALSHVQTALQASRFFPHLRRSRQLAAYSREVPYQPPKGVVCGPKIYVFEQWQFEDSPTAGPWPLKQDGTRRKYAGPRFWDAYARFRALPEAQQKTYRQGGGCQFF